MSSTIPPNSEFLTTHFYSQDEEASSQIKLPLDPKLFADAKRLHVMALQRRCFEVFCLGINLKDAVSNVSSLQQKGFVFEEKSLGFCLTIPPQFFENISWRSLRLWCELKRELFAHIETGPDTHSPRWRRIIYDSISAQKERPEDAKEIQTIIDVLNHFEHEVPSNQIVQAIEIATDILSKTSTDFQDSTFPLIRRAIEDAKARRSFFDIRETNKVPFLKKCSYMFVRTDKEGLGLITEYSQALLPKLSQEYKALYSSLAERAKELLMDINQLENKLCSVRIGHVKKDWVPEVFQKIRGIELRSFPTPEEFNLPLAPVYIHSVHDIYQEMVQLRLDYLPLGLQKISIASTVRETTSPKPKISSVSPSSSVSISTASSSKEVETRAHLSSTMTTEPVEEERSVVSEPISDLGVYVGDGGDPSFLFSDRVVRWFDPTRNVFEEDPVYQVQQLSPAYKEAIRFRHSFGKALIPVLIKLGQSFIDTQRSRISYTLPGEIIRKAPTPLYEKVVFTLSMNAKTQQIFHMYATVKTPFQIVEEYAKEGCFAADVEEQKSLPKKGERTNSPNARTLPDDGSRICAVSDEYVSVQHPDGTILNVYPFPDISK